MYKQIFFLWRRMDLSTGEFQRYYNLDHLNLASTLLSPAPRLHERYYPIWDSALTSKGRIANEFDAFDAMVAVTFDEASQRGAWRDTVMNDRSARSSIEADEARFIDTRRRMLFVVDAVGAKASLSQHHNASAVHVLRVVKRRSYRMSRPEFKTHYEREVARHMTNGAIGNAGYQRNYLLPDHPWSYFGGLLVRGSPPENWIDLIETWSFADGTAAADGVGFLRRAAREFQTIDASHLTTVHAQRCAELPVLWRP